LDRTRKPSLQIGAWCAIGAGLFGLALILTLASPLFGYDHAVRDMPVPWLVGGLMLAGTLYLALVWLIPATVREPPGKSYALLAFVLALGIAMRLAMFASEPVLEDDYQRYLWDGAVTAHGLNPYEVSPEAAKSADPETSAIGSLAIASGDVLDRVNHPELRTVYPPVAQGVFALSHVLGPWSLGTWRALCLMGEMATMALLLLLLRELARSPLWVALYWWNPLAVKELINSAHLEAILIPVVLGAIVLAIHRRYFLSTLAVVAAAGIKLWPVLLLPLIWRPLVERPRALLIAVTSTAGLGLALAAPILWAGFDQSSGLVAYAQNWKTNSALLPQLEALAGNSLAWIGGIEPWIVARSIVALVLVGLALWLARRPFKTPEELIQKCVLLVGALVLLSPAQFPWYFLWVLPLMPLRPVLGLLALTATMPLYYLGFYFIARDSYEVFASTIVWIVWVPVWLLLAAEFAPRNWQGWRARLGLAHAS
jgi:hypothetical protein